ncbi:MAG: hypothetical protein Q8R78_04960, partial [Candidatus Omnitrophota bacterium]|nr:hypothetical protein [Candidatus Omnitrophota bacterium]
LKRLGTEADAWLSARSWWRRADNIRRGLLVTQLATAVRNAETQAGRVGLDVMQDTLDAGLQRVFSKQAPTVHAADGFELVMRMFQGGKKEATERILQQFPKEYDRMLATYSSDITKRAATEGVVLKGADKAFTVAEDAVHVLNSANRFQEHFFRRGVFLSELQQRARQRGVDLDTILRENRMGELPAEDIRGAVDKALQVTFAESPAFGTLGQKFVSFVNAMPGATFAIPFPRFLVNSLKFFWDFSPVGLTRAAFSPSQWRAIRAGDTQVLSRGILGTGMLGAAWQFRNSEYAGERWYEAKLPDGRTVDLRPFNPFAAYLFVADVAKRKRDDRLDTFTSKDIAMGLLSSNLRAGTGLFVLDRVLEGLVGSGSADKAVEKIQQFAGEATAGLLTPLQQVTDLLAQFDENLATMRQRRGEPFLGPIKARIPGLAQTLPELVSPTREEPLQREAPLVRQLTGVSLQTARNPAETELERLGFQRPEILRSTGNVAADQEIARVMGPLVQQLVGPLVESRGYQGLTDRQKAVQLQSVLDRIKLLARRAAQAGRPELFAPLIIQRGTTKRQRQMIEESGATLPQ